jgi:hypothetical protein
MQSLATMAPLDDVPPNPEAGDAELAPLDARWSLVGLVIERAGEALREGGMLVAVFGLLDYFLGEGRQDPAWPWKCSAVGFILWALGVALEWNLRKERRR